jgi:hypothetical protein
MLPFTKSLLCISAFQCILLFNQSASAQVWNMLGNPDFSDGVADYTGLTFDSKNIPYMVYSDQENNGKVTVNQFNGQAWVSLGNADFSDGAANYASIAMDTVGMAYVAYQDVANGKKITVKKYSGNEWVNVGSPAFSDGEAYFTSIVISKKNIPYVVYEDRLKGYLAVVMKDSDGIWVNVGGCSCTSGTAQYVSMIVDNNDVPFIAYQDGDDSEKCTVRKFINNEWVNVGNAGFSAGIVQFPGLAMDCHGIIYVAYTDWNTAQGKASVMKFENNTWSQVGSQGISSGEAYFTTLAVDNHGVPYVAYSDWGDFVGNATMQKFDAGTNSWLTVGTAGFTPGEADFTSLAIDVNGTPLIGYSDLVNEGSASVMKCNGVVETNPDLPGVTASDSSVCGGSSTLLSVNTENYSSPINCTWYSGSISGEPVGTGNSFLAMPASTTTYYAKEVASCPLFTEYDSVQIKVTPGTVWFRDMDRDGFGNPDDSLRGCSLPEGYVLNNSDCDDNNASIYPHNAPFALNALNITSANATVAWSGSCGPDVIFYRLRYSTGNNGQWQDSGLSDANNLTNDLKQLSPGTTYSVEVCALNADKEIITPWSAQFDFTTPASHTSLTLTVRDISDNSATCEWSGGASGATYQVEYKVKGTSDWTDAGNTMNEQRILYWLTDGTTYNWQIKSTSGATISDWYAGPDFTTAKVKYTISDPETAPVLSITPNPSAQHFTINLSVRSPKVFVQVFNILGQVIYSGHFTTSSGLLHETIYTSDMWAAGMYLVTVRDGVLQYVGKLEIQK